MARLWSPFPFDLLVFYFCPPLLSRWVHLLHTQSLFFFPSRLAIIFSYKVNCSAIKDWYLAWKGLGMLDDFKIWLQSFNGSINYSLNWIIAKGEDKNFSGMLGFILQWYWPTLNITMWMNCSWFTLVDTEQCSEYIKIRCFCCTFAPS